MIRVVCTAVPNETPGGYGIAVSFTDPTTRRAAEQATRERLKVIADEQAALLQVATLVAQGAEPRAVFDAVWEASGRLIGAAAVNLDQFTPDEANLTLAGWSKGGTHVPSGTRLPLEGDSIHPLIRQTQAPARVDSYEGRSGRLAARLRELGIKSGVGAPVIVDGSVWGALLAGPGHAEQMPPGTEQRVASFAELIETAVSKRLPARSSSTRGPAWSPPSTPRGSVLPTICTMVLSSYC